MLAPPPDYQENPPGLVFKDVAGCSKWLEQLQLTNLHQVHGVLRTQLDELNRFRISTSERLQILELLRETVAFVQSEYAKKLIAKKLPLNEQELAIFAAIVNLWQGMIDGYLHCLHDYQAGDSQMAANGPMLCQRSISYCGLQIFEHLRTGYEFSGKLWEQLHTLYQFCEAHELHRVECKDSLGDPQIITCQASFIKILLSCYARPAELTRTQLLMLDSWLGKWGSHLELSTGYKPSREAAPPLAVNLNQQQGLQTLNQIEVSPETRYLPLTPLSKLLRVKIVLLQQGQTPANLELGKTYNAEDCLELLQFLHHHWCEDRGNRMAVRRRSLLHAEACYGIESIYAHTSGVPFKRLSKPAGMDTASRRQIETYGQVLSGEDRRELAMSGYILEEWHIEDFSILGARLLREQARGERIGLQQLIAMRSSDDKAFTLAATRWCQITRTGQLQIGIHYFPGIPQPVVLNVTGTNLALTEKSSPALFLPAVAEMKTPASLIISRNLFLLNRVAEVVFPDNRKINIKMKLCVTTGFDYERVGFMEFQPA